MIDEIKLPVTNICTTCPAHWSGKRTASIYDADGDKILVVPSFPHRRKSDAVLLAEKICGILNLHNPPLTGV